MLESVPLLGLLPATALLDAAGDESLEAVVAGQLRPVFVPARPPGDLDQRWTVEPRSGMSRAQAPSAVVDGNEVILDGEVAFVPDAPDADLLVAVGVADGGVPVAAAAPAGAEGVSMDQMTRYDATRALGHVAFTHARGRLLGLEPEVLADAWYLAPGTDRRESVRAVQTCLDVSVAYAKERFTFGRAIGSYDAIKHELTEVLRRIENARGLQYYAGSARAAPPEEFHLAASAARSAAGRALDFAARAMINVHGGTGASWNTTRRSSSAARNCRGDYSVGRRMPPTGGGAHVERSGVLM